jgi:hypothetical protein
MSINSLRKTKSSSFLSIKNSVQTSTLPSKLASEISKLEKVVRVMGMRISWVDYQSESPIGNSDTRNHTYGCSRRVWYHIKDTASAKLLEALSKLLKSCGRVRHSGPVRQSSTPMSLPNWRTTKDEHMDRDIQSLKVVEGWWGVTEGEQSWNSTPTVRSMYAEGWRFRRIVNNLHSWT